MTLQTFTIKDLPKNTKVTPENKCDFCTQSLCCTYITQEIDAPKKMKDYDYLLWLVSHKDVSVFKDDDGWFLSAANECIHLEKNGNCGIYHTRPQICRDHSNDCCEFDGPAEEDYKKFFNSFESLDEYCRKKFKNWDTRIEKWQKKKEEKETIKAAKKKARKEAKAKIAAEKQARKKAKEKDKISA